MKIKIKYFDKFDILNKFYLKFKLDTIYEVKEIDKRLFVLINENGDVGYFSQSQCEVVEE